ncbi:treacle protein [Suncus etruscus]|uniref:treacle protein n=1 Tax=Suncus etruscus TaxID=109475 RepID=UPI00210FABBA|nr:treacle protein [Suncus etruscus]
MAEARKRRELLPLVYQHLLQAGYVRAAREVKEQSGQKSFLAQPVTLLDIYTHWQLTSEVGQKRKAEEDAALQAKKTRVSDPTSSSESSEEEEEAEAETPRTTPRLSLTNSSASRTVLSASLKEKAPTKKTNIMVNSVALPTSGKTVAQLLSGKSPRKSSEPSADTILVSETEEEGSMQTISTTVQPGVTPVGQSSSSSDNTSSSSEETDIEVKPSVNAAQAKASPAPTKVSSGKKAASTPGKAAVTPPVQLSTVSRTKKQEEDSESTEESESEGLPVATPSQKVLQPSEKTGQVRGSLGLVKGTPGRGTMPTAPGKAGRPEEDSESSSEESDSEEDETLTTKSLPQAKPSRKSIQVQVASRLAKESPQKRTPAPTGRTKPAAGQAQQQQQQEDSSSDETHSRRAFSTARVPPAQAKLLGKSPQSRENTGLPEKRAAPSVGKKEEDSESSSEESDDKGATSTAGTLAQAKTSVTTPQVRFAPVPTKSSQQCQESSSESSDSEEEAAALTPAQAKPALKTPPTKVSPRKSTPATPPPSTVSTARVGTPTPWRAGTLASPAVTKGTQKAEEDSSSSDESESEEETTATAVGQIQSVRKSLPTKAALMPTKGASEQVTTPVLPRKAGPSATQTRTEMSEDSSSSEEESDSKESAKTPPQAKASVKTPQTKTTPASSPRAALPKGATASRKTITAAAQAEQESPVKVKPTAKTPQSSALPTRSPVCVQATSKGVVATAQVPSAPVVAEEESDSSEGEAPTLVKPPGMNSQLRTASVPAKGPPRERTGPSSTGKAGPTATQGGRHQEDSESSSEESDSEEEATGNIIQKEDNPKTSKRKSPASVAQKKSPKESLESSDKLPANQVIKLPMIFVDSNRSPAGPAAASARTQAAGSPRKARASASTARSSSSESEDEDMIPATQCSVPAINLSMVSEPTTPTKSTPKATVSGTSLAKTSSRIMDGKNQQAAGTQVTKKKQTSLPLTQAALKVLSQKASEAQSPAARTPSSAGVDSAPRTHPGTTSHGTATQASVAPKPRKAEVPAVSQAITSSSDSDSSSDSSSENEEEKQGPQRAHSASSLGAASSRDTIMEESSAESSEEKIQAPSQSLLSGCVTPQPTSATFHSSKANPRSDPSALGSSTLVTKDASNGKQRAEPQHATTVISPKAGNRESGTTSQTPRKPKKPKKGSLSPQASVAALKNDIEQRLLSELWPLSETQVQASVVKMLAELLDQERRKALEVTKDSSGRSGLKRKLQGDQATTKVPEKKKKKKQLEAREGGESAVTPEKNLRTAKGKPKKDRPSGDLKKKKKKKAGSGSQETKEKPEGVQGQATVEGVSSKDKKEKRKSNKKTKDKEKKEKKKAKKASTKDSSLQLQKKKKKKVQ